MAPPRLFGHGFPAAGHPRPVILDVVFGLAFLGLLAWSRWSLVVVRTASTQGRPPPRSPFHRENRGPTLDCRHLSPLPQAGRRATAGGSGLRRRSRRQST